MQRKYTHTHTHIYIYIYVYIYIYIYSFANLINFLFFKLSEKFVKKTANVTVSRKKR